MDTCSGRTSTKAEVRDASFKLQTVTFLQHVFVSLTKEILQLLLLFCSDVCRKYKIIKQNRHIKHLFFPPARLGKTNGLQVFLHLCLLNGIYVLFFPPLFYCYRTGQAAVPAKALRPPSSPPPPSQTRPWLSSSLIRLWTSLSPQSMTDPSLPAPPAGRRFTQITGLQIESKDSVSELREKKKG